MPEKLQRGFNKVWVQISDKSIDNVIIHISQKVYLKNIIQISHMDVDQAKSVF